MSELYERPVYPDFETISTYQRVAHLRFTHGLEAASITQPAVLSGLHAREHERGTAGHLHRASREKAS